MAACVLLIFVYALFYLQTSSSEASSLNMNQKKEWSVFDLLKFTPTFSPVPSVDCESKPQSQYQFCDPHLPPEQRATDLVSRLTVEEMINQTSSIASSISRLGIKDYNWRSNCLHGWSKSGGHWTSDLKWTVFPAPIGLGATFNPGLLLKVGQATADEGRALHNVMLAHFDGSSTEAAGLNCFSPNVNLFRDPRWGRGQETFGEDPFLISQIANAYTHGLQKGEDAKYLKVAACAKHYAVHSGPEEERFHFVANVTLHDLYDTYLPAFKSQVLGAQVAQIMPAYSGMRCSMQKDGAPDAANTFLLKSVLRQQFGGRNISVVSDNGAVGAVASLQKYVSTQEQGAAVCLNATTDIDLGFDYIYTKYLPKAVSDRMVEIETLRNAVWRNFYLRFRVGDFDPPSMVSYQSIDGSHLNTPENQKLNLQTARESIVLLKNQVDTLPLHVHAMKQLAVVGPNAKATQTLLSNYEGIPQDIVSVFQGIEEAVNGTNIDLQFAAGCADVKCNTSVEFTKALDIVITADYVVMVMGLDSTIESESHDRPKTACNGRPQDILSLPGCQEELIEKVVQLNPRVIVVLINGGPVSLPRDVLYGKAVAGIIEAFYPGPLGGQAVADVLFGTYNPGGRMPVTVFESSADVSPSIDYNMSTYPGRTYRYFQGEPLIPFGFGLSYTEFEYSQLVISPNGAVKPCDSIKVSVAVKNTGDREGDEVIQVYVQPPVMSDMPFIPKIQLVAFERALIKPSVIHMSGFDLNPYLLSLVLDDGEHYIIPGTYSLLVGGASDDDKGLDGHFTISGSERVKVSTCSGSPQCLACT